MNTGNGIHSVDVFFCITFWNALCKTFYIAFQCTEVPEPDIIPAIHFNKHIRPISLRATVPKMILICEQFNYYFLISFTNLGQFYP